MRKDLSENARIVAGSTFGFSSSTSLRYKMVDNEPSPEMQAALDELVGAGIVIRDDEPHGPVKYTASPDVDFTAYRRYATERIFNGEAPKIRIFVRKAAVSEGGEDE